MYLESLIWGHKGDNNYKKILHMLSIRTPNEFVSLVPSKKFFEKVQQVVSSLK